MLICLYIHYYNILDSNLENGAFEIWVRICFYVYSVSVYGMERASHNN